MTPLRPYRLVAVALALGGLSALGLGTAHAQTNTLTVTNLSDATTDGTCSAAGTGDGCTLREAINVANSNADQTDIVFDSSLSGTITLQNSLPFLQTNLSITDLPGTVAISGGNLRANEGDLRSSLLSIYDGATVTLSGLTLTQGSAFDGGGLIVSGGNVTLNGCSITNNRALNYAGGLYAEQNATLTLNNCTVSGNTAQYGGGLFTDYATTLTLNKCTLSTNTASSIGGGFYSRGDSATLDNCTISGNDSGGTSGGFFNFSPLKINSCTITGNSAPAGQIGGIETGGAVTLTNSIVAVNSGTDLDFYNGQGSYISQGYNLLGTSSTNALTAFTKPSDRTGVTSDQLKLGPLQNNGGGIPTIALPLDSIAINTGNTDLKTDERGVTRPQGTADDVGAYETILNESLKVTTLTDEDNGTSDPAYGTGTSLREAINYANSNPDASAIVIDPSLSGTIALQSGLPDLSTNLSITDAPGTVPISAKGTNSSVLRVVNGASVSLNGLGLRDGNATNGGGLFVNAGSSAVLDGCAVANNIAANYGGGIYAQDGGVSLRGCDVSGNSAQFGGGIFLQYITQGSTLTLSQSAMYGNSVTQAGGGLYSRGSTSTLSNSSVFGNTASGGAGGIYNDTGTMMLSSCTVANNSAPAGVGGGLLTFTFGTPTTLSNTIVANNSGTDVDVIDGSDNNYASGGYNLLGTSGTNALTPFIQAGNATGVTADQLKLGAPLGNGFRPVLPLLAGSIAINSGDPTVKFDPNSFDQRGTAPYYRVSGGRLDVGAYEFLGQNISGTVYNAVALGGVSGITITATDANSGFVTQTQTDAQGKYTLTLDRGSFTLTASKSGNETYRFAPLFTNPFDIDAQNTASYNFRSIGIGGRIVSPANVGISGITVNLYAPSDTAQATPLSTSITDSNGFFSLDNVGAGTWVVAPLASNPAAYTYTPASQVVTVAANPNYAKNPPDKAPFASFKATARNLVTGTVYNAVALGKLSGITITAVKVGTNVAFSTETDAQGNYTLSLVPGTYNITAKAKGGSTPTFYPLFTNPVTTKYTTTVCQFRTLGIGGRIISPSNVGIKGVTVNVYAQNDLTKVVDTSTSDAQGFFSLDKVGQGTWVVVPVAPNTYTYTPATQRVQVGSIAVFTSFKASVKQGTTPRSVNSGPRSAVVLSSLSANAAAGTLTLHFTGPLDAATAQELGHYRVQVDGAEVGVASAQLSAGDTLVLTLPSSALAANSEIVVAWSGVLDAQGLPLQGTAQVVAS